MSAADRQSSLERVIGDEYKYAWLRHVALRCLPPRALLLGELRVSRVEAMVDEARLADVISARLWLIMEEAGEQLCAPTLPVHDEPLQRREDS